MKKEVAGFVWTVRHLNNRQLGVSPGSDIMIHGFSDGITMDDIPKGLDWTKGCIAVANSDVEEIWHLVPNGTPRRNSSLA